MASFLAGLCCVLISAHLSVGALHHYSDNQIPAGYPFHGQSLHSLPRQYQFHNQYQQDARLQGPPNLLYVSKNPQLTAQDNVDIYQLARSLCDALVNIQSSDTQQAEKGNEPEHENSPTDSASSKESLEDNKKDATGTNSGGPQPLPHPLQPFRSACNRLYEQQLARFFPQPVPGQGIALRSAPSAEQAPNFGAPATGADGPDATELAQLQAKFAGVQRQEALAEESLSKNNGPPVAKSAKLEQLEPDAELIPGAQQPAQQIPPVPVNPGLLPGQRVYIVHGQPNLYGQNPLYNAVPGAFGPKGGVPLPGGYQKVYIVNPQSGLDVNYATQGVQGFPQTYYTTQGNGQPGVPLQFGQGGLPSNPGSILTQPALFQGFAQPLELSYEYQPALGTPYLPSQFVAQLKEDQDQSKINEAPLPGDLFSTTGKEILEGTSETSAPDVKGSGSADKPVAVASNHSERRRRKERRGSIAP